MMRPQLILWLAFISGAVFSSVVLAAPTTHQVRVTGVSKGELMVTGIKDSEAKTFIVNDATKILLDAKPAKLVDLQVGFTAEVTAEQNTEGKLTATMISASSKISPKKRVSRE